MSNAEEGEWGKKEKHSFENTYFGNASKAQLVLHVRSTTLIRYFYFVYANKIKISGLLGTQSFGNNEREKRKLDTAGEGGKDKEGTAKKGKREKGKRRGGGSLLRLHLFN